MKRLFPLFIWAVLAGCVVWACHDFRAYTARRIETDCRRFEAAGYQVKRGELDCYVHTPCGFVPGLKFEAKNR